MFVESVFKMQGKVATLKDITLDIYSIAMPDNLLFEEDLSPDVEEERPVFKVDSNCDSCQRVIRVCVAASESGIKRFQQLLTEEVSFLCPVCSRNLLQHGRFH